MNKEIKVSIITPSYNQGQFIEETILSVLNQTYKNIEYIVVDGGSTDNTMDVVNRYRDKIDIVIHEKDKGQSDAINKGFKLATGELVGWINSDDILYSDCVSLLVEKYLEKPDGAIYYNNINDQIDKNSHRILTYKKDIPGKRHLLFNNYDIIQQSSFYSNLILRKINYLDESIHFCMDLDLWLRLLDFGPIYNISDKSLSAFRVWEETKTSTGRIKFLREIRITLMKHGGSYYSKSSRKLHWYLFKAIIKQRLIK